MAEVSMVDWYNQKSDKTRSMRGLMIQIREDHAELNRLWERLRSGRNDISEIDELVRIISWLKQGLGVFEELGKEDIEGLSWGEVQDTKRDVRDKEMELKIILFSVSLETVYSHLR